MSSGKLYLIPIVISEKQTNVVPEQVKEVIENTDYFLVENLRTARRFISSLQMGITIEDLQFEELDKKTPQATVEKLMSKAKTGTNVGLMSESGCPGVADPGSLAVDYAHKNNIPVVPLVGPSSILLALMASGFNGQQFAFHGYLPIDKKALEQKIKALEEESRRKNQTQLFIEAPYRNNQLVEQLKKNCYPNTKLCVARDLSGEQEWIKSTTIADWRKIKVDLHKIPTVYALFAG
ncbi:SAM-dependent methyltransferase [Fulvivirga sp. RKSG066]|uniref:SAM-dependent methyltransferase n=1 Tax=Fulvivirga aurantia TaxID=2529383 RepID=UPI0012BD3309|nr:SAM-dependent methyltransferase [Fulvivirga aurantia]MTI21412.1 SAM-dependent methyltransferase [Fulvivirga aurantia]